MSAPAVIVRQPNPYRLPDGPCIIGVSGGRSSGMLLMQIVEVYDGQLPPNVHVCFENTGKEREETLAFVQRLSVETGVRIHWLQYRWTEKPADRWEEVSHNSAARAGEPFRELVERETSALPNPRMRLCTGRLKIRTQARWAAAQSITEYTSVIGFRADERHRVAKTLGRVGKEDAAETDVIFPLYDAGVTKRHVTAFWSQQSLDLQLPNIDDSTPHGNCDLCFLKGQKTLIALIREAPERADWWIEMESLSLARTSTGALFRVDRPSYAKMKEIAVSQMDLSEIADDFDMRPCGCHD